MRKRGLCCRSVSVCPSVTFVCCRTKTTEDILKHFSRPDSPIILVLDPERAVGIQFQGEPLQRGAKYTGVEKFAICQR